MEIFKNKFLVKLIATICLVLALFNFIGESKVYAEASVSVGNMEASIGKKSDDDKVWGGVLIKPILNLMTALGDTIMEILHKSVQEQGAAIIKVRGSENWREKLARILSVVVAIVVAVAAIAVIVFISGGIAAVPALLAGKALAGAFVVKIGIGTLAAGAISGYIAGNWVYKTMIPDDLYLPAFSVTAEEIFSNKIHLFDINFFSPKPDMTVLADPYYEKGKVWNEVSEGICIYRLDNAIYTGDLNYLDGIQTNHSIEKIAEEHTEIYNNELGVDVENMDLYKEYFRVAKLVNEYSSNPQWIKAEELYTKAEYVDGTVNKSYDGKVETSLKYILNYAKEVMNKEGLKMALSERTCDGKTERDYFYELCVSQGTENFNWDKSLVVEEHRYNQDQIALGVIEIPVIKENDKNYYGQCIVIFGEQSMSHSEDVLHYKSEVKIFSTAKHLQGVVAKWYFTLRNFALIVLMLILIYSGIRIVLGSTAGEKAKYKERLMDWLVAVCLIFIMHYIMIFAIGLVEKITELVTTIQNGNMVVVELTDIQKNNAEKELKEFFDGGVAVIENSTLYWPTDLAGVFRVSSQETEEGTSKWAGYSLCYVVLVLFTLFFAFTYLKRVVYMAFLTIIAPLVAMTYPIDKISDGKAQAFNEWLKEYIFNLMIQPLHLLLYQILVNSAFALASKSPIYALTAIGFMMPAEKLMRKFFGFEKAKTPGLLGGAAGAAIAMSGLQNIMKPKSHSGGHDSNSGKSKDNNKIRYSNKNSVNVMDAVAGGKPTQGPIKQQVKNSNEKTKQRALPQHLNNSSQLPDNSERVRQGNKQPLNNIDEDDIMGNTTLGSEDWDHGGFYTENDGNSLENNIPQPEAPKVKPLLLYNSDRKHLRSFDEEKRANKANNRTIAGRVGSAAGAVLKSTGKQLAGKVLTGFHPLRLAGKIATGATAATAGLLLGVASGDPSKAFQYTTAGAVAGSKLASSLSGRQFLDTDQIKQEAEMAYYGSDYKDKIIGDERKAFEKNPSNINYLRQTMGIGEKEAKEILNTTGGECFDNGITNIEDIAAIHKLTNGKDSISFNQAVAARNYAKKRLPPNADQLTDDSVEQYKARWAREYNKAGYANGRDLAEEAFNLAIRFNKAQSSLTKK